MVSTRKSPDGADNRAGSLAQRSVTTLRGVGLKQAEKLAKLKIASVRDVLFHLPLRYQDRTRLQAIADLVIGTEVMCAGVVLSNDVVLRGRRSMLCRIGDNSGELTLRFFHFSAQQRQGLSQGKRVCVYGEVRKGPRSLEIVHPEYKIVQDNRVPTMEETLTPVYPVTEGIHQISMRKIAAAALQQLERVGLRELLPARETHYSLKDALCTVHRPGPEVSVNALLEGQHPAVERLALEELVAHRLSVYKGRLAVRKLAAPAIVQGSALLEQLLVSIGFQPTGAQARVIADIRQDLARPQPMLRLIQGDVGSGKTLVAAAAAAMVVDAGYQVSVMAPTEILAEQHLLSFSRWFEPLGIKVGWLKGKLGMRQRRDEMESIKMGHTRIVIGTHALFQKDVVFESLGLTIVDEQHRFGVDQRLSLREKGVDADRVPHQLTMTATPIPRTLAMTAYADLDCSIIDELPPGRQPITTVALPVSRRAEVIERVGAAITSGKQVYWICTLVEESEMLQARAAEDAVTELREYLPEVAIGLVHGRMHGGDKDAAMLAFKDRQTALLVATTVVEVGVDVPNASLIIIENAERLGLSQLHQLRGRVGRGEVASNCVLMYEPGLSQRAKQRIAIMRDTTDGFVIAEKDLELRGAGELLGTRQTGSMQFRIADILRDRPLLERAREIADQIVDGPEEELNELVHRWMGADAIDYGVV